jgi:hypothetical protein
MPKFLVSWYLGRKSRARPFARLGRVDCHHGTFGGSAGFAGTCRSATRRSRLLAFVEHTGASADAYPREAGRVLIAVIDEDRDVRPQARARRLRTEAVVKMPRRKPGSGVNQRQARPTLAFHALRPSESSPVQAAPSAPSAALASRSVVGGSFASRALRASSRRIRFFLVSDVAAVYSLSEAGSAVGHMLGHHARGKVAIAVWRRRAF